MKLVRYLLSALLVLTAPAHAVVQSQLMANVDLSVGPNTYAVVINNAWTGGHTITLPPASATAIGQSGASSYYQNGLVIYDAAATLSGSHVLTIAPASGDTINGSTSSFTTSIAGAVVSLYPTSGYGWTATVHGPGTYPATTCTNQFVRSIATTGLGTCATVDLANDTTGILGQTHGGAGTITGALKGNGSGTVSQAACADLSNGAAGCSAGNATNAAKGIMQGDGVRVSCTTGTCTTVLTATLQQTPAAPTGTTSATYVMMGLGADGTHPCLITPVVTGRVRFNIRGSVSNTTIATSTNVKAFYNTGTIPINGAAVTGNQVGTDERIDMNNSAGSSSQRIPFDVGGVITGLTLSTQIWLDAALATTAGTATIDRVSCDANEF